jgi:acetylornithine deacetylase/succinyl-diaminopimelate desuccinylase-like protein
LFVPDEEIGGIRGMKKLITLNEFKKLNVGFVLDEGYMKTELSLIYLFHLFRFS